MCTKHQDWIVFVEWHGQGCFSATYTANPKYVSIRSKQVGSRDLTSGEYWWMRGQNLAPCCQDLGTQLYHSSTYTTACQKANKEKGKFVSIALGESLSGVQPVSECVWISVDLDIGVWFQLTLLGLPKGWTSPCSCISHDALIEACPWKTSVVITSNNFTYNLLPSWLYFPVRFPSTSACRCSRAYVVWSWG